MPSLTNRDQLVYERIWATTGEQKPSDTFGAILHSLAARDIVARVADLGCGIGRHSIAASQAGHSVTAIDHHPRAVEVLRRRSEGLPVTVLEMDMATWASKQSAGCFDTVVCFDSLHHVSPDLDVVAALIRRIGNLLAPSGHLLITLLCDVRYSSGEIIESRLKLDVAEGEELLDSNLSNLKCLKGKIKPVVVERTVGLSESGEMVQTRYESVRVLRWYQRT